MPPAADPPPRQVVAFARALATTGRDLERSGLTLVAALGGVAVVVVSRGDVVLAAALLALAALEGVAASTAVLGLIAVALRWGTTDLGRIAGDVGVLGRPARVGPAPAALACLLVGAALLATAAGARPDGRAPAAAGRVALALAGVVLAMGPLASNAVGLLEVVLAAAAVGGVEVVARVGGVRLRRGLRLAGPSLAGAAVVLAALR